MKKTTFRFLLPTVLFLGALVGCGGSASSDNGAAATVSSFEYTDPATTGWRLVKDSASTQGHLVLTLMGPADGKARGVGFNLQAGAGVRFAKNASGAYFDDLGVFQLGAVDTPTGAFDVKISHGGLIHEGTVLTVGIFQKDRRQFAQSVGQGIARVRIDLPVTGTPGTVVPLSVVKARIIPTDLGVLPPNPSAWNADMTSVIQHSRLQPIDIAVGTLVLR